ncbi:MAG: UDP-N-acetylmuramoyl-L-alanyl-D-glutamate--2,6-diaminopimelate ligase [Eubacteriales bacterium]|nr:UDP-N-acetylmuramoyl-L-alanyl-D-glutamate--2,6-diaminopimelate ligase [Eubacteriales bacterium]
MTFQELISGLDIIECSQNCSIEITNIVYDSRKARNGSLFVAIDGYVTDGHKFIEQAVSQDVSAVLIQHAPDEMNPQQRQALEGVFWARVPDTRRALAYVSDRFFNHPSGRLDLIGITGTKGKTTTAYMVRSILMAAGRKTGLIGTVANMIGERVMYASRTTPESYDLQVLLDEMTAAGLDSCSMEVSSQGLKLNRVYGCHFKVGAFTNLYEDHIGPHEHADMEEYLTAKMMLFPMSEQIVVNRDIDLYERVAASAGNHISYGLNDDADVRAIELKRVVEHGRAGTAFRLYSPWFNDDFFVAMPGRFNVSNALAAVAICGCLGLPAAAIKDGLAEISVPGRVQSVPTDGSFQIIVDYAHNAASLEKLLETLREYVDNRLIVVFGNGGDRARSRRFEMGAVSGRMADYTIITSDNPRTEDPMAIIEDIITGIKPTGGDYEVIPDRRDAIAGAIKMARSGDMIVIAGKGHETYQIFKDKTIHFDDAETAAEILAAGEKNESV